MFFFSVISEVIYLEPDTAVEKATILLEQAKDAKDLHLRSSLLMRCVKLLKDDEEEQALQNDNNDGKPESNKNIINKSPRRKLQHQHRKLHFNIDQQDKNKLIIAPMPPMLRSDKDLQFRIPTSPQTSAGTLKHLGNERRHRIENNKIIISLRQSTELGNGMTTGYKIWPCSYGLTKFLLNNLTKQQESIKILVCI